MPLSTASKDWDEGRYDEWDYDLKPLVPPQGNGSRRPSPVNLTFVPNIDVSSRMSLVTMASRIPAVLPMRPPSVIMPNRVPRVEA